MQNKNLKLKLGLCGLALTSFLAVNARTTVHADTVSDNNANNDAITWDSDSDDSQVVKGEPQQQTAPQSVQKQAKQSTVQASQSQPVQNKKIMVSDVSSVSVSQKRAETSIVRQSNAQTSTVNRLNANKSQANIKVSSVQDVAQAPVQKQKVAQFNQGSKIYSLNNSSTLSKNNGDGYVITNAGTYNGRAVDIGVTINNVKDSQGSYTTKWSNGDKADVTGKTDSSFKYDNSVLLGTQQGAITVPNKTRNRPENKTITKHVDGYWGIYYVSTNHTESDSAGNNPTFSDDYLIDPQLLADVMAQNPGDSEADAVNRILRTGIVDSTQSGLTGAIMNTVSELGKADGKQYNKAHYDYMKGLTQLPIDKEADFDAGAATYGWYTGQVYVYHSQIKPGQTEFAFRTQGYFGDNEQVSTDQYAITEYNKQKFPNLRPIVNGYSDDVWQLGKLQITKYSPYEKATLSPNGATGSSVQPVQVTDHLQLDHVNNGSLNYDYTVGLYDAQTGDLITDLKPEYKSKAGKSATNQDTVMNNAIKAKIQAINANKANSAYTGTVANDDVAFYKETRAVHPQDQSLHKSATRIISVNLPDDQGARDRYKGILNSNNQIVQTINFTRTGVENIVSGQVTYGAWTGPSSFGAVTLPDIPGYTMTMG